MQVQGRTNPVNTSNMVSRAPSTAATQPTSFGDKLKSVASTVGQVGLAAAGAVVPGGSVLQSALGSALGGSTGGNFGGTAGLNGSDMVNQMMSMNMQFLALQSAMEQGSRQFNTLSNASKNRHESAMNSIRNLK